MQTEYVSQILAVDDDPQNHFLLRQILKSHSHRLICASSGDEAFQLLSKETFDLILLDILMPGMDGLEVCRLLKQRKDYQNIPVIFLTSINETQELVQAFKAGAVDYITKPFSKDELTARVNTHLKLKRATDEIALKNQELSLEITQRRQTEDKLQALSLAAFEALLFVKNGNIIEANHAATQVLKYELQQLINMPVANLLPEDAKEDQFKLSDDTETSIMELEFERNDKTRFYGLVKGQSFRYQGEAVKVLAINDITRHKQWEQVVRNAIADTEDRERERFSMDLHDEVGVLLSTLKIFVNLLQKPGKTESEKEELLKEISTNLNFAVATVRRLVNDLTPTTLDQFGVFPALEAFAKSVRQSGALKIELTGKNTIGRLPKNIENNLYKICTELINNTLKHSGAQHAFLSLQARDKHIELFYHDNGIGCNLKEALMEGNPGQGLKNIVTRVQFLNGKLYHENSKKPGFVVRIKIPTD